MRRSVLCSLLAVAAFGTGLGAAPALAQSGPVRLGVNLELSGRVAPTGNDTLRGIEAAQKSSPEALGRKIELSVCDNASMVEQSVACANRFVDEGVTAVLGSYQSNNSIPAGQILQKRGIVMISTGSTNPATTKIGDYIFRIPYTDDFQGKVGARYAYDKLGARRAAIFRQQDDDYSFGLAVFFQQEFEKFGGATAMENYVTNNVDFSSLVNDVRAFKPDVIYFSGFCAEGASLIPQLRRSGFKQPILGADAADDAQCPEGGGEAFNGFLFTSFGGAEVLTGKAAERAKAFETAFRKLYPDAPFNGFVLSGADAYNVVVEAITKAGSTDPAKVRDALANLVDFPGVTGNITYKGTDGTPADRTIAFYAYEVPGRDGKKWAKVPKLGMQTAQ